MGGVFAHVGRCARLNRKGTIHLERGRRRQFAFFVGTVFLLVLSAVGWTHRRSLPALVIHNNRSDAHFFSTSHSRPQLAAAYGRLPLSFEVNTGQTDARARFVARGRGYSLFLTDSEAVLALKSPGAGNDPFQSSEFGPSMALRSKAPAVLRMSLLGANPNARISGLEEIPGKSNYFLGNDSRAWRKNVPNYRGGKYATVYPGLDLVYYATAGRLEYDFVVAPAADPKSLPLLFSTHVFIAA